MTRFTLLILLILTQLSFSQQEWLKELSTNHNIQNQDTTKVNTSIKIIKLLYNSKDYSNALKFANESELLSKSLDYDQGLAKIKHFKGLIDNANNNFDSALKHFITSKLLYSSLNDKIKVTEINSDIAILEINHGNRDLGLKYALSAIKTYEDNLQYNELIHFYYRLIYSYESINLNDKAIVFSLKKLDIINRLKDLEELIKGNKKIGLLYRKEENYSKAIDYLNKALSYDQNNKTLQADLFPILGDIYLKNGALTTAKNYLKEGLQLNRDRNNIKGIISSLSALSEISLKHKHYLSAEKQLLKVNALAHEINDTTILLSNYKRIITLDSINGNFKRAFKNQTDYFALLNALNKQTKNIKNTYKLASLGKKDNEDNLEKASSGELLASKLNNDENVVSKNKFDRFRKTLYFLIIGFSILAIFLIISYFKRNKGLRYTRDLELENKKIELQKEAIIEENKHIVGINNTKDKLFSIVSHDLKDSLNSTKGLIDLLKEDSITKDEFNTLIPELSESANNASLLLFNLLNWSKSQMNSLKSKPITFDVKEIFEQKIKLVEQKLIAKNITLINNSNSNLVFADKSMVEIVIQNILTNAIKFSNSLDKITIINTTKKDKVIISITDTGVGISKENISKLFGNYKNFTTTGTHNEKGTGLGLSICKDLIKLNNGRIWVESILGNGSTFFIELPAYKQKESSLKSTNASEEILRPSYIEHSHLHKLQ